MAEENKDPKSEPEQKETLYSTVAQGMISLRALTQAGYEPMESPAVVTRRLAEFAGMYPLPNVAVNLCIAKWEEQVKLQQEAGKPVETIHRMAKVAFCACLPKLSSRDEVSEFIACVAYGMANGIIPGQEGTRLLYAAQVAHSTLPSPKRRKKRTKRRKNNNQNPPQLQRKQQHRPQKIRKSATPTPSPKNPAVNSPPNRVS